MKDRINQLAKGIFEYEKPAITLSENQITVSVAAGEVYQGSFMISNEKKRRMKGLLVSDCPFLSFEEDEFFAEEATIHYTFDAGYMNAGDAVKSVIQVISDCGECGIAFTANIEVPSCNTSAGKIKDLFHFANYAKEDTEEAVKLFRSPFFESTFLYRDSKNISIYRGLKKSMSGNLAMEEFLVAVHKKLPIHIKADKTSVYYEKCRDTFMDTVVLAKDNWGFMELHIHADADFIIPDHKILWTDQFMGNVYRLQYVIDSSKLCNGKNYGKLVIASPAQTIEVSIVAEAEDYDRKAAANRIAVQEYIVRLTDLYIDFRMNRIAHETYVDDMESLLYKMDGILSHTMIELYRLHLAIVDNRETAVREYLDVFEGKADRLREAKPLEYLAGLYLKALYTKEEADIKDAISRIQYHYGHGYHQWQVLWLLFYLDEKYENPQKKLTEIYAQIAKGCHSPVLYYEAYVLYCEDALLLHELNAQTILVMNWAIKKEAVSEELALQYAYLASRERNFLPLVYFGLTKLYEQYEKDDILSAICSMLIRGQRNHARYYRWFARGVEKNLRIVDLYEYYMYTFPEESEDEIAHKVLLYFVHDNHLPVDKKAFLFAWLIRHRGEHPQEYKEYRKSMEQFMAEQLEAGNISRNLAVVYEELITRGMIDKKTAMLLPNVMFRYEIACDNPNITGVYVVQRECRGEVFTPLVNGKAIIEMVTDNAEVFLCDRQENRYCETIPYTVNKLLHLDEYAPACYEYNKDDKRLLLYLYQRIEQLHKSGNDTVMIRKRVLELPDLSSHDRKKCFATMVQYYFDNFEGERLEELLLKMDWNHVNYTERAKMIEYCIIRNLYEKAFEGVNLFGYEGIARKRLLQMAEVLITENGENKKDDRMLRLCHYVFTSGKFNETILRYLIQHYNGTARELFALWRVADGFELDTKEIEERLLAQMLFADSYVPGSHHVFVSYYRGGTNRKLICAYLAYSAHRYLVRDIQVHDDVFGIMRCEGLRESNKVCILALLKYYSEKEDLNEEEARFCDYHLQKMTDEKAVFSFFKKYGGKVTIPYALRDKFIVEYICNPNHPVTIHYRIERPDTSQEFTAEPMENRFEGIHVREFVLFHGETLQYYITEQTESGQEITESISAKPEDDIAESEENRYHVLNTMIIARQMRDEKTLIDMMEEYAKDEGLRRMAFKPLGERE